MDNEYNNTFIYAGIAGFIVIVIILVIYFIMRRKADADANAIEVKAIADKIIADKISDNLIEKNRLIQVAAKLTKTRPADAPFPNLDLNAMGKACPCPTGSICKDGKCYESCSSYSNCIKNAPRVDKYFCNYEACRAE